jgi:hypothetical protein
VNRSLNKRLSRVRANVDNKAGFKLNRATAKAKDEVIKMENTIRKQKRNEQLLHRMYCIFTVSSKAYRLYADILFMRRGGQIQTKGSTH